MPKLAKAIQTNKRTDNIDGIDKRPQRRFIDLNKQPPLDYSLIKDIRRYTVRQYGYERLSFQTSRGCPYGCNFCYCSTINKKHRKLSIKTQQKDCKP